MSRAIDGLSREQIAEVALRIVHRDGLEALTMRKLADELGVSPPAVYRHFDDKEAIVRGLVEHILRTHELPDPAAVGFRRWLSLTFVRTRRELTTHAATLPLLASTEAFAEHAVAVADQVLGVLMSAGLEPRAAASAFRLLMSFTLGQTLLSESARRSMASHAVVELFEAHPNVVACGPHLLGSDADFEAGLEALLDLIEARASE